MIKVKVVLQAYHGYQFTTPPLGLQGFGERMWYFKNQTQMKRVL